MITLLILLILTAVTIKIFINRELISMTVNAGKQWSQEEQKEKNELDKTNDLLRGHLGEIEGTIKFGELEWKDKKASVTITKTIDKDYKIEYKIINKDGETIKDYTEIESGGKVENLELGDFVIVRLKETTAVGDIYTKDTATLEVTDLGKPIITVTQNSTTSSTIKISVSAEDEEAGMPEKVIYRYYIKKSIDPDYPSEPIYTSEDTIIEFTELEQNTNYDIKAETEDIAGNTGVGELKNIQTGKVPDGAGDGINEGAIKFGNLIWENKQASVSITKTVPENYTIQYKVTDKNGKMLKDYTEIHSGGIVSGLNLGDLVIARLTDGTNYGNTATLEVTDLGKPNITINKTGVTSNTLKVTAVATDNEAGMPERPTYKYYIKKSRRRKLSK